MAEASYTTNELMAVAASRSLQDGQNIVVGLGLPQVAAFLAKATHAPDISIVLELGVVNPEPHPGVGLADPRLWFNSEHYCTMVQSLGGILQKGLIDVGFLGGLQIDRHGNINSTIVEEDDGKTRHFTGSGGAADIASFSKNVFVVMRHEKRKIIEQVGYLTSAGYLQGGDTRRQSGLPACESVKIITNLGVFGFSNQERTLEAESLHPGVTPEDVINNTGANVRISPEVPATEAPTLEELEILRTRIDPARMYIR